MPTFELVKTSTGDLRGFTQKDDQAWKRWKGWMKSLGAGEFFSMTIKRPRDAKKHRRFMALLRFLFEHWDPESAEKPLTYKGVVVEKNFDAFRRDIVCMAGFGEPTYELGPRGGVRVRMEAKSIAYAEMEDDEFDALYKAVINVGIKHFLPRSYDSKTLQEVIAEIERFDIGGGPA